MEPPQKRQRTQLQFTDLPLELQTLVLQQPELEQRVLRQVCQQWRSIIDHTFKCGTCFYLRSAVCEVCHTGCCACSGVCCTERRNDSGKLRTCGRFTCRACLQRPLLLKVLSKTDDFLPCEGCRVAVVCSLHERGCEVCGEGCLCWQCVLWCEECGARCCSSCSHMLQCACRALVCKNCAEQRRAGPCGGGCGRPCCHHCAKGRCSRCGVSKCTAANHQFFCGSCDQAMCRFCRRQPPP